jgi:uncharacterized membrane protein YbhN (UPF0104 family)
LYAVLVVLLVWLLFRERDNVSQAIEAIKQADMGMLLLGVLALFISVPASALVYMSLSPKRLRFGRTTLVQTAGLSVNKLLPSGGGAMATSFLYLKANKLTNPQAGTVVVMNNLLGFVGHLVLFCLLLALYPETLDKFSFGHDTALKSLELFGSALILLTGLAILFRAKLARFTKSVKPIFAHPARLLKGLGASMLITLSYALGLWAASESVGIHLTLTSALIVLSGSVLATAAVPTPGGIGAAEAGAYAGLIGLGVNSKTALAAALLFRVCTFWVLLIVGTIALGVVAKRGYLRTKA